MTAKIQYDFSAQLWQHNAPGGWFFIAIPADISKEIRDNLQWQEEGWGRMKASAIIRNIEWETAIWFDKKRNMYLLPVKADIRKKAHLKVDDLLDVRILL